MGGLAASIGLGASVKLAGNDDDDGSGGGGGGGGGTTGIIGKFTGAVLTGESPQHGYLADAGEANTITAEPNPQLYPTAARTFSAMRVTATGGGSATLSNYTVTLYKNGVATAQQVTVPSLTAAGTVIADLAHPIAFAANDKFDVRWDIPSGDGSALNLAVVLEGTGGGSGGGGGGGPVGSAVSGLTFPIVAGTPTLTAVDPVILPGLEVTGNFEALNGALLQGPSVVIDSPAISGTTTISGGLDVTAATTFHPGATVTCDDQFEALNGALLQGTVVIDSPAISGTTTISGGLDVSAATTFHPGATVTCDDQFEALNGALLQGTVVIDSPSINGTTTITGGVDQTSGSLTTEVGVPVNVKGDLQATGTFEVQGNPLTAPWPVSATRWYAVDGAAGNDSNAGFSDVSEAAAGAAAKKTIAGLNAIFPPNGAGRSVQIVIASGTYTDAPTFLVQLSGYAFVTVKGTATQANAGSVAFAGTSQSDVFCGGILVPGLNAAGYNPTAGATTTVIPCQLNGGGAAALPAEPAAPLGWRIRFDIATATVALRGICRGIAQVQTGTITISDNFAGALAAVPAPADVFYIEKAGVIDAQAWRIGSPATQSLQIAGMDMGALSIFTGRVTFSFCGCTTYNAESASNVQTIRVYQVPLPTTTRSVGGGLRVSGNTNNLTFAGSSPNWGGNTMVGTVEILNPPVAQLVQGCYAAGLAAQGGGNSVQNSDLFGTIGSATAIPLRIIGNSATLNGGPAGLILRGIRITLTLIDIQTQGANPAIRLMGACEIMFAGACTGSTGNTDVGLDLQFASGCTIILVSTPTVTGTAGDVRLAGGAIVTWATAAAGIQDQNGNRIFAPGNAPGHLTPVTAGAGVLAVANAPAGATTYARYFKVPDGAGGFYTIGSLT